MATATRAREASAPAEPPDDRGEWISTSAAIEILGRGRSTIFKLARDGFLTLNRPGKRTHARFLRSEVEALARRNGIVKP